MEPSAYLEHLRADGDALAAAARRAPIVRIPSCPDWDMTGLLAHTGRVHRWVDEIVGSRSTTYVKAHAPGVEGPEATLDWYREGLDRLLSTLMGADPDEAVWNWVDRGPGPARFWLRRMAHETAIHRWDAQAAAGEPLPIAADLAVDGIDEYVSFAGQMLAAEPVAGLEGSLHLHATDTVFTTTAIETGAATGSDGEWTLDLWPDRLESRREHAKCDAALRGPVSDLLLWMLNRVTADAGAIQAFGDAAIVGRWRLLKF